MFLGFRTQHINFWPLATGRETPPTRSGDPPPHPGSHRKNLFMFMCLFLSWVTTRKLLKKFLKKFGAKFGRKSERFGELSFCDYIFFSKMCRLGGTKYVYSELCSGILRGPGKRRGGAVPLRNPQVTSLKACLRNADVSWLVVIWP